MASQIKPVAGLERICLSKAVPLTAPLSLFIFPTTFCNFKCVYCGHSLGHVKMKEQYGFSPENMSMDTFQKTVEQLKQFDTKIDQISLTGHGEPLLNPHMDKMVSALKKADVTKRIEIITNASLLTKELSRKLIDGGLDCLRVSIQGVKTEKYKDICKTDATFEEIVQNLAYFYSIKGSCDLFVKVMDVALDRGGEKNIFYKTFENISDRMYVETCRPVYDGVEFTKDMEVTKDRYGRAHEHRQVCPLPFFVMSIFPNGDVVPCDTIYKPMVLGNVNAETLKEMWQGKKLRDFRLMQLNKQRQDDACCKVCCAPDDVSHPEDVLDNDIEAIKARL